MRKILLLLMCIFSINAYTQEDYYDYLDTMYVQEVKVLSNIRTLTPITSKILNKSDIEFKNIGQEPSYILNQTPSITNYSDNGSYLGYSYFRLRGIDQTRINMTLDGVPLNEGEDQGAYFSNYPDFFSNINSLEIQRGVGTSINGTSSYAGSINFESPLLTDDPYNELDANLGSFNTYRVSYKYNSSVINNKAVYVALSKLHTDGYKYHSGNDSKSAFFSTGYFKNKNILKLTGFIGNQKNDLAWLGVSKDDLNKDLKTNGCNDREKDNFTQALLKILWINTINSSNNFNFSVYYNKLKGNYDFDLNNYLKMPLDSTLYNYAISHDIYGSNINYAHYYNNLKYYTGINVSHLKRQHIGSELYVGELYNNYGTKNEFDYYNKLVYNISDFSIYGDVQYRYVNFGYHGDVALNDINWDFVNYRFGLSYNISQYTQLYYNIGKSFREPTRNDIFLGNDNLLKDSLNNPIIGSTKAEQVIDNEIGFKTNTDEYSLNMNVYYMGFKDEIVLNGKVGPNGILLHSNVDKSYRSGLELDFDYFWKDFTFSNNSSYSYNKIKENNIEIEPILTPNLIINQDITYDYNRLSFTIGCRYQSESYLDFANQYKLNDFYTFNTKLSYTAAFIECGVFVNNIFNKTYYTYGLLDVYNNPTYFVSAPINFNIYAKWNF